MPMSPVIKITNRRVPGVPDPVDVHVGGRVRLRRKLLGLSQGKLADAIGLTFQQVQKYERGANRISASRVFDISQVLEVPISFFYDDMPDEVRLRSDVAEAEIEVNQAADQMTSRETLTIVGAYYKVKNARVREAVFQLIKAMAKTTTSA